MRDSSIFEISCLNETIQRSERETRRPKKERMKLTTTNAACSDDNKKQMSTERIRSEGGEAVSMEQKCP